MSALLALGLLAGQATLPAPILSVDLPASAPIAVLLNDALPDTSFGFHVFNSVTIKSGTLVTPGVEGGLYISCASKEQMTRVPQPAIFTGCTVVPVDAPAAESTTFTFPELLVLLGGNAVS